MSRIPLVAWCLASCVLAPLAGCGGKAEPADTDGLPADFEPSEFAETPPADTADTGNPCGSSGPEQVYVSPDDSNSMSSPVQARLAALDGTFRLGTVPIRTWEFLNYHVFELPPAEPGTLDIHAELAPLGEGGTEWELAIALATEATGPERAPVDLIFSVDTSGSMAGGPLEMAKSAMRAAASSLRAGDRVSLVTWSSDQRVVLASHAVTGADDLVFLGAVDGLAAGGGTDLSGGLSAAYEQAQASFAPDRVSRVVLVSDGGANIGLTDEELIGRHAGGQDERGIYLVGVGVGTAETYDDTLMDRVTDLGRGASLFVGDSAEAWRMFGERFTSTLGVAARDVRIRLDLPAGVRIRRFSGEEMSRDPQEVEPQHAAPDDAMIFYLTLESCEALDEALPLTVNAWWKHPTTFEEQELSGSWTLAELQGGDQRLLTEASAVYHYAEALRAERDGTEREEAMGLAWSMLERAEVADPGDPDLAEIRAVLEALAGG